MLVRGMEVPGVVKIDNVRVYGLKESVIASGYPKSVNTLDMGTYELNDGDERRMRYLGNAVPGSGHDCYLKGIIIQFDLQVPEYIWRQLDRYHHIDYVSSQSKMHKILELDVDAICNKYVTRETIDRLNELIRMYNNFDASKCEGECIYLRSGEAIVYNEENLFRMIIANTPSGLMLTARMTTNYLQLKSMVIQREHHKMQEWRMITDWMKGLPLVSEIVLKKHLERKEK